MELYGTEAVQTMFSPANGSSANYVLTYWRMCSPTDRNYLLIVTYWPDTTHWICSPTDVYFFLAYRLPCILLLLDSTQWGGHCSTRSTEGNMVIRILPKDVPIDRRGVMMWGAYGPLRTWRGPWAPWPKWTPMSLVLCQCTALHLCVMLGHWDSMKCNALY